jgi:hypothetical protein
MQDRPEAPIKEDNADVEAPKPVKPSDRPSTDAEPDGPESASISGVQDHA